MRIFFTSILLGSLFLLPLNAHAATLSSTVTQIRYWTAPDYTRVVIDVDRPTYHRTYPSPDKNSIVIELKDCNNGTSNYILSVFDSVVKQINLYDVKKNVLRLEINLHKTLQYKIFSLKKYLEKPDRIVIDIFREEAEKEKVEETKNVKKLKEGNIKIVVIDPGHGGEDPGAIGSTGIKEKDVVLAIGKKLQTIINKEQGMKAYLTRTGDYFIPLTRRVSIANEYTADIFISLHADASKKKKAKGTSIFYLSEKGASDEAARLLAEKENASDLIGGNFLTGNPKIDPILIDMSQNLCRNDSIILSNTILNNLSRINRVHCNGVKFANFVVLKSVASPSVLLETAFISNREEERYLTNSSFQNRLVRGLTEGIKYYFSHYGRHFSNSELRWTSNISEIKGNKYRIHKVKKGENLWRIANNYGVDIKMIIQLNKLKEKDRIVVDQELKIPLDTFLTGRK
ncbi:MAG: N-acetylmuramoyl-L-alanine amidase [bacterium]